MLIPCLKMFLERNLKFRNQEIHFNSTTNTCYLNCKQGSACPTLVVKGRVKVLQQQQQQQQQQEAIMVTRLVDKNGELKVNKTENLFHI